MSFWPGERLLAAGTAIVEPFDGKRVDCNAYTLSMGDRYFRTADAESQEPPQKRLLANGDLFFIPAGQFAFLLTDETVKVPRDAMAFISMRLRTKLQGLINVSGFNVDPGYEGKLVFGVYNAGPEGVPITRGDRIFKIWFCDLAAGPSKGIQLPPGVKTSKSPDEGVNDIDSDLVAGMSREILSLQSLSAKLRLQEKTINDAIANIQQKIAEQKPSVDGLWFIWRGLSISVIAAILFALLGWIIAWEYRLAIQMDAPTPTQTGPQISNNPAGR